MGDFNTNVYTLFNPELCYMNDEELRNSDIRGRVYSYKQVYDNPGMLINHLDGYSFDYEYYNRKYNIIPELTGNYKEMLLKHFIDEGFNKGYFGNPEQEKCNPSNLDGINFFGYGGTIIGQGASANSIVKALELIDIPMIVNHVNCKIPAPMLNKSEFVNKYKMNIIHINPDRADIYIILKSLMKDRYNIGIWTWETEEIPSYWIRYIKKFNEIWTISAFTADAIARVSSVPVINIKPPLEIIWTDTGYGRKYVNENKLTGKYIYMYSFDFMSYIERKNPIALVSAFKKIYQKDKNCVLILKTMNMPYDIKKSFENPGVFIINESMSLNDYFSLLNICDCYVSPHRCEGQGRTIMEAMYFGKKIVATGYSGNLDFMDVNNSYHIKWNYIQAKEWGIYKGHRWADPSIGHLVKLMILSKVDSISGRFQMNERAKQMLHNKFNYKFCSNILLYRLKLFLNINDDMKTEEEDYVIEDDDELSCVTLY